MWDFKTKNQSNNSQINDKLPPQQLLQVGVGGVFRSHPGGNAAGGGLMEAELES